jgi:hypothetical protein
MHVIHYTSNLDGFEAMIVGDSGHIWPKFGLEFFRKRLLAILGGEDHVDAVAGISV